MGVTAATVRSVTVGDALTRHYVRHGLPPDGGEGDSMFRVRLGPFALRLPNPPARRRAVFFHDVNHVLTGYDTTFSGGEMAIAAFEVGSGCGRFWIAWLINLSMFAFGLVVAPRGVFRAFVRGRRVSSVYRCGYDRATLSAMPVDELRSTLGLDAAVPAASVADCVRFIAWSVVAAVLVLGSFAGLLGALWRVAGFLGGAPWR